MPEGSPSPVPPEVLVVVPTHRRPDGLRRLVEGLAAQTLPFERWAAVIVDDGSGREYAALVDRIAGEAPFAVRVVHLEPGRGPAGARNAGWRAGTAPLVAFIDDDCRPAPQWLASGVRALADPAVGVVQGRTVRPFGSDGYRYTPFTVVREVTEPSPWFEGCNVLYRRSALLEAGGFDERFGRFPAGEDTYLGWAVIGHGWSRAWAPEAVVEHELAERPWSWHLRFHWREGELVRLASEHPEIRRSFWRPWAVKRENALFAAAVASLVASARWYPALVGALPYVLWLAPGRKVGMPGAALQVSAHAASLAAKLGAGVRWKTLLL